MPLNDEQLAAIMQMGDIGGQEDELARQQALSEQLRNKVTGIQGGGVGGNIGRAGYGVASAISDYRSKKMVPQISADKRSFLADLLRRRGAQPTGGMGGYTPGPSAGDGLTE